MLMGDRLFDIPVIESKAPSSKWFKEWVPQEVVSTGGRCYHLKWVTEDTLKSLRENSRNLKSLEPDPVVPTTEVLFLCSYEGCGKTFVDSGAIRKHCHIHGERQYSCHYEGCGKKFLDSSKLKRHFLIHTGERDYVCPHEGCGKAFSLDFNLRSHMKTHSQSNYHICPFAECGKRYAHEYKLKNHLLTHHEKSLGDLPKYAPSPPERPTRTPKTPSSAYAAAAASSVSSDRPYGCPYEGCAKAYIHEYKLNLHLRREHPFHFQEDNQKKGDNGFDQSGEHDAYAAAKSFPGGGGSVKPSRRKVTPKMGPPPPTKGKRMPVAPSPIPSKNKKKKNNNGSGNSRRRRGWPVRGGLSGEGDSEDTEEDRDIVASAATAGGEQGWRYRESNVVDDEETEYED